MLRFQAAREDDIPLLRALAERIWRGSYAEMISSEQMDYMLGWMYAEETIRREMADGVFWEMARLDDAPIGFHSLTFTADGVAKLNKLYLLPELHGRGLGREMIERALAVAAERGAREVRLQVNKGNVRAQRAYERAGFRTVETAVFDIGGGFVMDDLIMSRPLQLRGRLKNAGT